MIDQRSLLLAFTAGMVATINPCGFAMLPAYLSYFLGLEDRSRDARTGVMRALSVGLCVSGGFMSVFAVMGVLITQFSVSIEQHLPWVTIVIGIALTLLGIAMVRGFEPVLSLPKLQRGTGSRELPSMFVFGVSYAVSSLSCTIPLFLALVASTFTQRDFGSGMSVFIAYAFGMGLVLMALTLTLALARQGLVRSIRRALPYINRIAGGLLAVAGLYLTYFGWYELQVRACACDPGGPASTVFRWNGELAAWVTQADPRRVGVLLVGLILFAVIVATAWRSSPAPRRRTRRS